MAFKRSAVRSRLSPPLARYTNTRCSYTSLFAPPDLDEWLRVSISKHCGIERRLLTICRWHIVTAVAFPQKSDPAYLHHVRETRKILPLVEARGRIFYFALPVHIKSNTAFDIFCWPTPGEQITKAVSILLTFFIFYTVSGFWRFSRSDRRRGSVPLDQNGPLLLPLRNRRKGPRSDRHPAGRRGDPGRRTGRSLPPKPFRRRTRRPDPRGESGHRRLCGHVSPV